MNLELDQYKKLVTEQISLVNTLYKYNPSGNYNPGQGCFCPFHDNTDTPSAFIYEDDDQETLFCFSERKSYSVADALETLLHEDIYKIGEALWTRMSSLEQQQWLATHITLDYTSEFSLDEDQIEEVNVELELSKQKFKKGKIKIDQLLDTYMKK